jgi:hypothetical protein
VEFDETLKGFQQHVADTADIINQEWLAGGAKIRDPDSNEYEGETYTTR